MPNAQPPRKRAPRPGIVGPLFRWELVRLARRGQDARARFILAGGLLLALSLVTIIWFSDVPARELFFGTSQHLTLEESATFGSHFAMAFLFAQLAVFILLTPACAAGGIAEEKERRTLDFLLVSDLTNREILLGKFLGRLVFLLGVMFAGLPILAMTQVYGGVSLIFLLLGYAITTTTVILLSAIAVTTAVYAQTYRGALFWAYGFATIHACSGCGLHPILSPFGVILTFSMNRSDFTGASLFAGVYMLAQLFGAAVASLLAFRGIHQLRVGLLQPAASEGPHPGFPVSPDRKPIRAVPPTPELVILDSATATTETPSLPVAQRLPPVVHPLFPPDTQSQYHRQELAWRFHPPVDSDDPLYWKEWYITGHRRDENDSAIRVFLMAGGIILMLGITLTVLMACVILWLSPGSSSSLEIFQVLLLSAGSIGLFCHLLNVGVAACGTICRERIRSTLDSLLLLPIARADILRAKWQVSLLRGWWWGVPSPICIAAALSGNGEILAALAVLGYIVGGYLLVGSYGLWLSIRSATIARAVLRMLPIIAGIVLVPILVWNQNDSADRQFLPTIFGVLVAGIIGTAGLFWWDAVRAFEHYGRQSSGTQSS